MSSLTIEQRPRIEQTELNLRRWDELVADHHWAKVEGRIETDRHGRVIMSPPPAPRHGNLQSEIVHLLRTVMTGGRTITECPISTADGVKAADVAWATEQRWAELGNRACFVDSPEICVEVMSPSNTEEEIREKMALYFHAGAKEVWICGTLGAMTFYEAASQPMPASRLCPAFPTQIDF